MGSVGFIILGLAIIIAVTSVILKVLSIKEKADERKGNKLPNENADR